jgi:hypothetical protein
MDAILNQEVDGLRVCDFLAINLVAQSINVQAAAWWLVSVEDVLD